MKRISAYRMTCLRPSRSARTDEKGDIISAKSDVEDVMIDLSIEVNSRFESEGPIDTRVADTTPVSSIRRSAQHSGLKHVTDLAHTSKE